MATFAAMATPIRQIPGTFVNTPADNRQNDPVRRRLQFSEPQMPAPPQGPAAQPEAPLPPVLKAAQAINQNLQNDESYPDLDSCCRPGASSEYDMRAGEMGWEPFHRVQLYKIPEEILLKFNGGQITTKLGLFADINHAWASIDNCLFLWDYTHPDPELIGYEDAAHNITAVALVPPRRKVFNDTITHILVVATSSEIVLLGVSATETATGTKQIELYQTRMSCHRGGADVSIIASSEAGRVFFGGDTDTDICELYYQQEEGWFSNRVSRINHTRPGWSIVPSIHNPMDFFSATTHERLIDIKVDDTRNLVYTLSSKSTIRTYHMEAPARLTKVIEKEKHHCLRDVAHMIDRSPLLNDQMSIISLSPIPAREASKLHLMALTSTGCRLFLSATSSASYMLGPSSSTAPQSMQVQFVKFPPREQVDRHRREDAVLDLSSQSLADSISGRRFPPGYFFDVVRNSIVPSCDQLFTAGPDTGRIKKTRPASALKYYEHANWIDLPQGSRVLDIGLTGTPFAAAQQPMGFGNELAVQFDQPPCEIAVLTNSGVFIIRRKRLVDIFADTLRIVGNGEEGLKRVAHDFVRQYGRVETISAALAVACGQGSELRGGMARAVDHSIEDRARQTFVDFGGQPTLAETDASQPTLESVRYSSRFQALALYVTRLVRTLWKTRVITLGTETSGPVTVTSTVPTPKLVKVQESIERLRTFLDANKGLIQGLTGPSDLQQAATRQAEVALVYEHQAFDALQKLMASIIEGISFVQMLFDERVTDIYTRLDNTAKLDLQELRYEALFSDASGKELAKILVKAIVNRNIQNGSHVETVADALRRRCGSFCSPDDVVIFKAQEQLQRATEQTGNASVLRTTLNESLRLFEKVAGSLTQANLQGAVEQYMALKYYAGAIQLCLAVARERDRGNKALSWFNDGKPPQDGRSRAYEERKRCYDLIHDVLVRLDADVASEPRTLDGRPTLAGTKHMEAYSVVNDTEDEVFHFDLYEWYIEQKWTDRILAIESPHVVKYLRKLADTDMQHADLLCRFYTHRSRYFEAAQIQFKLAMSDFDIGIRERITFLSRAKANASVSTMGVSREQQQELSHAVAESLEIANIQDDLFRRLLEDDRIPAPNKDAVASALDGKNLPLSELFNVYADKAAYYDVCLIIYHVGDYHNARTIAETWQNLIDQTHHEIRQRLQEWEAARGGIAETDDAHPPQPYEMVTTYIQNIARRTSLDSTIFPIETLIPMVCQYAVDNGQDASIGANPCWPVLLFLQLDVSHALIVQVLEHMFETREQPFAGRRRKTVVQWINVAVGAWTRDLERRGGLGATGRGGDSAIGDSIVTLLTNCEQLMAQLMDAAGVGAEVEELRTIRLTSIELRTTAEMLASRSAQASMRFSRR